MEAEQKLYQEQANEYVMKSTQCDLDLKNYDQNKSRADKALDDMRKEFPNLV
jgi:hypothetical protein